MRLGVAAAAASWQKELLLAPSVVVGPSTVANAGDGVFANRPIAAGETVTWIDYAFSAEDLRINTYSSSYFEWHEQFGGYELADRTKRNPSLNGVGHLINDAAALKSVEWDDVGRLDEGASSVEAYVYQSERDANVEIVLEEYDVIDIAGQERSSLQRVVARKDLSPGDELFRCYGAQYWLQPAEYALHYMMDFARVDLRLVGGDGRSLFEDCERRLSSMVGEYRALTSELDLIPFDRTHPYTDYDGYEIWLWAHLVPPRLRQHLAERLGVYDSPFLESQKQPNLSILLRQLHLLPPDEFGQKIRDNLSPPFDQDHDQKCQDGLAAGGRSHLAFGRTPDFPW